MLLIGDIGGTRARLALVDQENDGVLCERKQFDTAAFSSLQELVALYQKQTRKEIHKAVIAVAGPVKNHETVELTNQNWSADVHNFDFPMVLLNDLEAAAWGVAGLSPAQKQIVQAGTLEDGLELVIGMGTGLGMAIVDSHNGSVFSTEIGHSSIAPYSDEILEYWQYILEQKGRVRVEDFLSGLAFEEWFRFYGGHTIVSDEDQDKPAGQLMFQYRREEDIDGLICHISQSLGSFLADQIIAHKAKSVYLCGGVIQKMPQLFVEKGFWQAFADKAPMKHLVEGCELSLVMTDDLGLLGARHFGSQ